VRRANEVASASLGAIMCSGIPLVLGAPSSTWKKERARLRSRVPRLTEPGPSATLSHRIICYVSLRPLPWTMTVLGEAAATSLADHGPTQFCSTSV
jgi:hypothetical protein